MWRILLLGPARLMCLSQHRGTLHGTPPRTGTLSKESYSSKSASRATLVIHFGNSQRAKEPQGRRQKAPRYNLHLTALASAETVAQDLHAQLDHATDIVLLHAEQYFPALAHDGSSREIVPHHSTRTYHGSAKRMLRPTRRLRPRAYVPRRYDAFQDPRMKQHPVLLTRHETSRTALENGTGVACQHSIHEHVDMQSDLDVTVSPLHDFEPSYGSYGRRACSGRVS